ncbi:hypothetical protein OQA88_4893 [Cercophora sp. LCS_1]
MAFIQNASISNSTKLSITHMLLRSNTQSARGHVLVCTGKNDWPSRIEDDNSGDNLAADLRELVGRGGFFSDPFHNISVLNSSFPSSSAPRGRAELQTTSAYLLPSFKYVPFLPRVSFGSVEALVKGFLLPEKLHKAHDGLSPIHRDRLTRKVAYQNLLFGVRDVTDILVLICGHGGRDQRCGIYGPLLQSEFEAKLPAAGVEVVSGPVEAEGADSAALSGEASGHKSAARVGLISHIGGHKFAGNVIVYLPPGLKTDTGEVHPLAGHGIWYGRVEPKHVEGIVAETVLGGNVITDFPLAECKRFASTEGSPKVEQSESSEAKRAAKGFIRLCLALWVFVNLGALPVLSGDEWMLGKPLNSETFIPFTVISRTQVSPTSFILEVKPNSGVGMERGALSKVFYGLLFPFSSFWKAINTNTPVIRDAWDYGLWSVEIKQPQLQVARDYTPLPAPSEGQERKDIENGILRFFVRKMDGGEVSSYLSRLQVGETVELRGPHMGFDVRERLGSSDRVVFVAGGTGIAPALQTVRALAHRQARPDVAILWANRHRADCPGVAGPASQTAPRTGLPSNAMVDLLGQIRGRYGSKLNYSCVVDEEGGRIGSPHLLNAAGYSSRCKAAGWFGMTRVADGSCPNPVYVDTRDCRYHGETANSAETDRPDRQGLPSVGSGESKDSGASSCQCRDSEGRPVVGGRNLLMVSGPEGFVAAYAGPKVWGTIEHAAGKELQGPVGGMAGMLKAAFPRFWADWQVLKL